MLKNPEFKETRTEILPVRVVDYKDMDNVEGLLNEKEKCISFGTKNLTVFRKNGSWVLLDFGKEICGGIRLLTRTAQGKNLRLTFGESVSEAMSSIGNRGASNDHSPRDFDVIISFMSDLTFGQTGFRFVKIELLDNEPIHIQSVFAISVLPEILKETSIITSDDLLNKIISTAAYTLKLNIQNGYIWDGIKRDRLVWSGDLHPSILTSLYLFGDNANITNSLEFLKNDTGPDDWMNTIPSYSFWWVINVCDYCTISGNTEFFEKNKAYSKEILRKADSCIDENGQMNFGNNASKPYFLDWSTCDSPDAVIGTASVIIIAAKRFLEWEDCKYCRNVIRKLSIWLRSDCLYKPTKALQILAARNNTEDSDFLEHNGSFGFSTFMAYYILTADAISGGSNMLTLIKEYYGGMLSRGATSFWEDFDISWLENSGRIDCITKPGEKDLHGDFGKHCYKGFRHSLCHAWSCGVIAFVVEYILGMKIYDNFRKVTINPHPLGITSIKASFPTPYGDLTVDIDNGCGKINAPTEIDVIRQ